MLNRMWSAVRTLERVLVLSIFVAMIAIYAFNVAVREITPQYSSNFAWVDEFSRYLMVWGVFLCLGLAFDRGRHIAMTTVLFWLPPGVQRIARIATDFLGMAVFAYFSYLSIKLTLFVSGTGQISPTLGWPIFLLYIAPSVGFLLLSLRYLLELISQSDRREAARRIDAGEGRTA